MRVNSLSVLRVRVAERDGVAGIVAPEEKPWEEKRPEEQISLLNFTSPSVRSALRFSGGVSRTSSGCRWAWCLATTPWSGWRWRRVEKRRPASRLWLWQPPGGPSAIPSPPSWCRERCMLGREKRSRMDDTEGKHPLVHAETLFLISGHAAWNKEGSPSKSFHICWVCYRREHGC